MVRKQMAVAPEKVGEIAVKKTLRKAMIIIPGALSRLTAVALRILPRRLVVYFYGQAGQK